jgi:hypothetical protein
MRGIPALLAWALALAPAGAQAQNAGGVPAYEPPPPVTIQRTGEVMKREPKFGDADKAAETSALVANFASAYQRNGAPRLALYWNRQLSEALNEWYSPTRVVDTQTTSSTMGGEITLNQTGSTQNITEVQQRVRDQQRAQTPETFDWEFQDGFLGPFLEAGAQIIDRAAMMRLTGVDMQDAGTYTVETRALQGKADFLMEILVASNWKSTTGYELRARILDIKTGRIVAYVNSKGQKNWNPAKETIAGGPGSGFITPEEYDEDDEMFGPVGEDRYRATASGFERKRKPPKLEKIARSLAINTMDGLMKQWK